MKLRVICVGRLKEKFYTDAVNEFKKRLSRFAEVEIVELADEKAPEKLSDAELEQIKLAEGRRILGKLADGETVVALEIRGVQLSSFQDDLLASDIQNNADGAALSRVQDNK